MNQMSSSYSRRKFIHKYFFLGSAFLGAGAVLTSCDQKQSPGKENKMATAADSCDDFSAVSDNDKKARQKLGYVNDSPIDDMTCDKCNLWLPPSEGKKCGGCMLFKGPVYPSGYCTYWTARQT